MMDLTDSEKQYIGIYDLSISDSRAFRQGRWRGTSILICGRSLRPTMV